MSLSRAYRGRRLQAARRAIGRCPGCGEPVPPGTVRCTNCRGKSNDYAKVAIADREASGLCVRCGKEKAMPTMKDRDYPLCETCYLKATARSNFGSSKFWEALLDKLVLQDYKCPYSGERIILGMNDALDHIVPISKCPERKGDLTNVEWVTREMNHLKARHSKEEFLLLLPHLLAYHEEMTEGE